VDFEITGREEMSNYAELRALALAATPGNWSAGGPSFGATTPKYLMDVTTDIDAYGDEATVCNGPGDWSEEYWPERSANMEYIAAANPAAILALLDEVEALRAQIKP
jgi:hypothetical protein